MLLFPRGFVKKIYTEFHENPTNCLVFDTKPLRDGRTKIVSHAEYPSPHPRKGRFNQQVRERNKAWQVTTLLLLPLFVSENILLSNIMEVLVKLLS